MGQFDVFLTADRNLSYQQDLSSFDIAVVVLVSRSNRLDDLRPLVPRVLEMLPTHIQMEALARARGNAKAVPFTLLSRVEG